MRRHHGTAGRVPSLGSTDRVSALGPKTDLVLAPAPHRNRRRAVPDRHRGRLHHRGTAYNVVTQALAARQAHSVDQMRDLELARLEAAHAALWPRAMQGHVTLGDGAAAHPGPGMPAARPLRAACHGREGSQDYWDHCEGPPTVVISPDDRRHRGCPTHGSFAEQMTTATSTVVQSPS